MEEDDQNYGDEEWQDVCTTWDYNYQDGHGYDEDYHPNATSSSSTGATTTAANSQNPNTREVHWQINAAVQSEPPFGLQSSMLCQRVEADYSVAPIKAEKNYIGTAYRHDYLMIDSGAQACVCSPDYYPDIAVVPLMPEHTTNTHGHW